MKKKSKRICMAVTNLEYSQEGQDVRICGREPLDNPNALYVPLCAAHRAIASVSKIKVFADGVLADYRL